MDTETAQTLEQLLSDCATMDEEVKQGFLKAIPTLNEEAKQHLRDSIAKRIKTEQLLRESRELLKEFTDLPSPRIRLKRAMLAMSPLMVTWIGGFVLIALSVRNPNNQALFVDLGAIAVLSPLWGFAIFGGLMGKFIFRPVKRKK